MLIPKCCKGCSGRGSGVCNCTLPTYCQEYVEDEEVIKPITYTTTSDTFMTNLGNWVKCPDCEEKNKEIRDLTNKIKKLEKKQKAHIESIEGFVASSKKKNNKIERLKKGISKAQKNADKTINASKKIKNSKAFDIATIATQLEKERELNKKVKDKDHQIAVLENALNKCYTMFIMVKNFGAVVEDLPQEYFIKQAEKELEEKDAD